METHQDSEGGDLPGSSVVKTLPPSAGGVGLTLGQGPKITHAFQSKKQNIKQKQYCNKFNKAFKNETHTKVLKNRMHFLDLLNMVPLTHLLSIF